MLTVRGGERLLDAALGAGLAWPYDCRVGSCGTCRCVLRAGAIKPLTDFSYTLEQADIAAGAILACQTRLKSDIEVEVVLGDAAAAIETASGRIARVTPLTHDIVELEVSVERPIFAAACAGQYAEIGVDGIDGRRSYSFARRPDPNGARALHFAIRHVPGGAFTDWLFGADRVGSALDVAGPYGDFRLRPAAAQAVFVAGGSGLAPIVALLEEGVAAGRAEPCQVYFGARTQADLYYLERLAELGRRWRGPFELRPVLSAEPADSDWRGLRGLVSDALGGIDGAATVAYLCGPPPMVDAGIAALAEAGVPSDAVFHDKFLDASTQPGGRAALGA